MRNTTYYFSVIFILVYIIHNAESRRLSTNNAELNPSRRSSAIDNFDVANFVNTLFKDAKKKNKQLRNRKRKEEINTEKNKINKNVEDDSNYDSLGIDDHVKNQIVRSNRPKTMFKDINKLIHSSNTANHKKIGHILRSGGGSSINNSKGKEGKALKAVDEASNEKRSELIFDLEEDDL